MLRDNLLSRCSWLRASVCISLTLLASTQVWAQEKPTGRISGRVLDDSTSAPIVNANVFIANTMLGTSTDTSGYFVVRNVPPGSHELVASCIGYIMATTRIELSQGTDTVVGLRLVPRLISLGIVEVTAPRAEEWRDRLTQFERLLFGSTPEAEHCRIVNPEVLSFSTDARGSFLAQADARLIIENDALGYRLNLSLGQFRSEGLWTYTDWKVIFEDLLSTRTDQKSALEQKRDDLYYGSLRHFLIALVSGHVSREGYTMYLSATPYRRRLDRVLELSEDDISRPSGSGRRTLQFPNFLIVEYDRTSIEAFSGRRRVKASVLSIEKDSVRVDSRGQILDPFALGVRGDWAKEKLAVQLPLEFLPITKK